MADERLKKGDLIWIYGLAERKDLNGRLGKLLNYDAAADRWAVKVDTYAGESVRIRPNKIHWANTPQLRNTTPWVDVVPHNLPALMRRFHTEYKKESTLLLRSELAAFCGSTGILYYDATEGLNGFVTQFEVAEAMLSLQELSTKRLVFIQRTLLNTPAFLFVTQTKLAENAPEELCKTPHAFYIMYKGRSVAESNYQLTHDAFMHQLAYICS